ncbi:hypothetical protein GCM10028807_62900 [Spirosoma daeguense]
MFPESIAPAPLTSYADLSDEQLKELANLASDRQLQDFEIHHIEQEVPHISLRNGSKEVVFFENGDISYYSFNEVLEVSNIFTIVNRCHSWGLNWE